MSRYIKTLADSIQDIQMLTSTTLKILSELVGYTAAVDRYCALLKDAAFREEKEFLE